VRLSLNKALILTYILLSRDSYFAILSLMGDTIFQLTRDYHNQRDALIEAEAARLDDMLERIRSAARNA
jgi:hypothetical protein